MKPIALLSDFGATDWFVGEMKGTILSINPLAAIVDISHDIPAGDITAAAFNLLMCHSTFPAGTIFVAAVDPRINGERSAICIKAGDYFFVGPDNGLFSMLVDNYYKPEIRILANPRYFRKEVSTTFRARDLFAPVAAHLSKGVAFEKIGHLKKDIVNLSLPTAKQKDSKIVGCIVYIDHFGNAITNIFKSLVGEAKNVLVHKKTFPICNSYAEVLKNDPLAVIGSCGYIELSVNEGNAAKSLKLKIGDSVTIF